MTDRTEVLSVDHLTKYYVGRDGGAKRLLANDDLSLRVHAGEIVALLGPNGAGKSTFLKQVGGQLMPSSGRIAVAGVDMVRHPRAAKEMLSAVPQECVPLDNLSVEEHVRYFGLIKGVPSQDAEARLTEVLTRTGLLDQRTKLARELSGGFKRRLLIAIALTSVDARLLLLDEPTTGLDPEARRSVWSVLEHLRDERKGILLTTHYIEEAEHLADRVVVIDDGRFIVSGTVEEIRRRLSYGGRLEIRDPGRFTGPAREAIDGLRGRYRVALDRAHVLRFEVPDPFSSKTVGELARLADLGVAASLAPVSLEDVYLSLVGNGEGEA